MLVQKIPQWLKYLSSLLPTCLPIVNCSNKMLCTRHTTANTDVSLVRMRACVSVHDFRISCLLKFAPFLYKFKRKYKNLHHQSIKLKKKSRPTFDTKTNKINHTKKKTEQNRRWARRCSRQHFCKKYLKNRWRDYGKFESADIAAQISRQLVSESNQANQITLPRFPRYQTIQNQRTKLLK